MRRRSMLTLALLTVFVAGPARADAPIKEAKLGVYIRYANANLRVDKVESVRHLDGNPIVADQDGDDGYVIISLSVQNPGKAQIFMPPFVTSVFLADESKLETSDPRAYVGTKTAAPPDQLEPKETVHLRLVVTGWAGTAITKIVLDPADQNASPIRVRLAPTDVKPLVEIPKPKPTD